MLENKALPNAKINERRSYPFEITDSSLYVEDETDFNPTVEITVNHDETIRETEPEINVTDEVETADYSNEKPFIFDDNIEENEPIENIAQTENVTNVTCETVEETNVSIDENPSETQTANDTNATFEYTAQEDKAANDEYSDEEDDLLAVEDGTTSNRREYKSILSSLFPKKEEKHAATEIETDNSEERTERNEQTRYFDDDYSPARSEIDGYYEENVSSERYPSDDETAEITNEKTDRRQQTYYDGEGSTDFSDLYNMAKREGFKIKASYNTNKYYGDRVFVNKLNFHSSIIWYLVLFVEMLIMNLTLSQIVNWSSSAKLILVFSTAVFPVVCFVIYNINKTKTAKELASFKDVIEIALIITFQITIIILCVALFASVDFGNIIEVTSFVLIPFIFALNIPIYFMIKYALYGTGKYFVGDKTTRK